MIIEVHFCVVMMKTGYLVSFEHSINFDRLQDVLIRRSSAVIQKLIKYDSLNKGRCVG